MNSKGRKKQAIATPDDPRARLIETAIQLFATNGYEGTSVRDLAAAANVNVAAVSYHFGSKDALYLESLRACLAPCAETGRRMRAHLEEARGCRSRKVMEDTLSACIQEFLELLISHANPRSQLVMREQMEAKPRFAPVIREFFQPVGTVLREVIAMLAPTLPDKQAFMVISGIIGQCVHTYKARATYMVLAGVDPHSPQHIRAVSTHIAHFTAIGLRALERERRD